MSLPPLCEMCGTKHHGHQAHVFSRTPSCVTSQERPKREEVVGKVEEKPAAAKARPVRDRSSTSVKHAGAVDLGRRGGLVGGKARAARLSPERRAAIARAAAAARWGKRP